MSGLIPNKNWKKFLWGVKNAPKRRKNKIVFTLIQSAELILRRSKTHYLTGAALKVQTGRLRSSMSRSPVFQKMGSFYIDVGTKVWYGKRWEEGLKTGQKYIFPKNAKVLKMVIGGKTIYRKWAKLDPKPRPFIAPAIEDEKPNIFKLFSKIGVEFE